MQNDRRRSFTYGHFPLYLGVLGGEVLHDLASLAGRLPLPERTVTLMERANTACEGVAAAGRLVMALLDTLTILLLFLLGRRIYGTAGGLLAATLYAFTAQAIQLSHFFAMDPASTTFVVLAVYGGVLMVQDRSWCGVLLAGIGAGLAISSKFSALPILAVPLTAAVVMAWQSAGQNRSIRHQRGAGSSSLLLFVSYAVSATVFAVTSPYAVLDWANFIQATLVEQGRMVRGVADFPFTRQYRNTVPYLYFIQQQVVWGMGLPLGLVALAGSVWGLAKLVVYRARAVELVVWAWVIPYFGITGAFLAKFNRYMSPVLPFAVLFCSGTDRLAVAIARQTQVGVHSQDGWGSAGIFCHRRRSILVFGVYEWRIRQRAHVGHREPLGIRQCAFGVVDPVGVMGRCATETHSRRTGDGYG